MAPLECVIDACSIGTEDVDHAPEGVKGLYVLIESKFGSTEDPEASRDDITAFNDRKVQHETAYSVDAQMDAQADHGWASFCKDVNYAVSNARLTMV